MIIEFMGKRVEDMTPAERDEFVRALSAPGFISYRLDGPAEKLAKAERRIARLEATVNILMVEREAHRTRGLVAGLRAKRSG